MGWARSDLDRVRHDSVSELRLNCPTVCSSLFKREQAEKSRHRISLFTKSYINNGYTPNPAQYCSSDWVHYWLAEGRHNLHTALLCYCPSLLCDTAPAHRWYCSPPPAAARLMPSPSIDPSTLSSFYYPAKYLKLYVTCHSASTPE